MNEKLTKRRRAKMKKFITMILVVAALFVGQLSASETSNDWVWVGAGWVYVGDDGDGIPDPPPPPPIW